MSFTVPSHITVTFDEYNVPDIQSLGKDFNGANLAKEVWFSFPLETLTAYTVIVNAKREDKALTYRVCDKKTVDGVVYDYFPLDSWFTAKSGRVIMAVKVYKSSDISVAEDGTVTLVNDEPMIVVSDLFALTVNYAPNAISLEPALDPSDVEIIYASIGMKASKSEVPLVVASLPTDLDTLVDGAYKYDNWVFMLTDGTVYRIDDDTATLVGSFPNIASHLINTSNPHSVTKAQVGLTNADDTSDANKPISEDQAAALALKADKLTTSKLITGTDFLALIGTTTNAGYYEINDSSSTTYFYGNKYYLSASGVATLVDSSIVASPNLFNLFTVTNGYYLNYPNTPVASASWCYSDYIPVINGKTYSINGGVANIGCALYNDSKVYLDTIFITTDPATTSGMSRTFTISNANVAYMRVSFYISNVFNSMVVEGTTFPNYSAYGDLISVGKRLQTESNMLLAYDFFRATIVKGLTFSITSGLTGTLSGGVAYIYGSRVVIRTNANKTFTASKDTYADMDKNGVISYTEVANGGTIPTVPLYNARLAKIVTDGSAITSIGNYSGNQYLGYSDTFVAGNQYYNTVFGYEALAKGGNTKYATAFGYHAMYANFPDTSADAGLYNTAFGYKALEANIIGNHNTAVGFCALQLGTGNDNTAVGEDSMLTLTTGYLNTAVGVYSLKNATTGYNNTAIGVNALANLISGYWNTAIGESAGIASFGSTGNCDTDDRMTFIGALSGVDKSVNTGPFTNSTAIGAGAKVDESNMVRLGGSSTSKIKTTGVFVQSAWVTPTLLNSWVQSGSYTVGYFKDTLGFVHLRGVVSGGALYSIILKLPAGYRPQQQMFVAAAGPNGSCRLNIQISGDISVEAFTTTVGLDGFVIPTM